jgi:hypothetical protein
MTSWLIVTAPDQTAAVESKSKKLSTLNIFDFNWKTHAKEKMGEEMDLKKMKGGFVPDAIWRERSNRPQ